MTLPANIRINTSVPFPALVTGSGPVTVTKVNGIWTLGFSVLGLGPLPGGADLTKVQTIVWNQAAAQLQLQTVSTLIALLATPIRMQRSITAGPVVIQNTDQILNLNLSAPLTITLPTSASRIGNPVTFKDIGRTATTNPVTLTAFAGDTIDGFASVPLNVNGQSITLVPCNDGVNNNLWSIE